MSSPTLRPRAGTVCPGCGAPLPGSPSACPACALPLVGPDATELYRLDVELESLDGRRSLLLARRPVLLDRLAALRDGVRTGDGAPAGSGALTADAAWRPGGTATAAAGRGPQVVLLGLGVLALLVGAAVFLAVAWSLLGVAGQVGVMLGVTVGVTALSRWADGRGLGATAEALAVLAGGLALADVAAARALGLAGLDGAPGWAFWTGGLALLAVLAGAAATAVRRLASYPGDGGRGRRAARGPCRSARCRTRPCAAPCWWRPRPWSGRSRWRLWGREPVLRPAALVALGGSAVLAAAAVERALAAAGDGSAAGRVGGTVVAAALVALALLATRRVPGTATPARLAAGLLTGVVVWLDVQPAGVDGGAAGADGGVLAAALLAAVLALTALLAVTGAARRALVVDALALVCGVLGVTGVAVLGDGGVGGRTLLLAVLAAGASVLAVLRSRLRAVAVPLAAGLAACSGAVAGDGWWSGRADVLVLLALGLAAAAVAAWRRTEPEELPTVAVALLTLAGAFGLALDRQDDLRLAALVAGATAVAALAYALLPGRDDAAVLAVAAASGCTWLLQADAGVTLLEAYSLPLAGMLLVLGAVRARRYPLARTWTTYGPAAAAALLPSAVGSLDDAGFTRAGLVLVAAAVVVALSVWRGWQAPLGSASAAVLIVLADRGAPVAAQVPQWVTLSLVGAALLAVGATYEQRRQDLARAGRWVAALH